MKNKILRTGALLFIVPLLASCGGGGGKSGDANEVVFWHTFGAGNTGALERKAEEFASIIKEQTGKEVKITLLYAGGYDEAFAKIRDGFAAGDTPTMAIAYPDHVAEYLVQEGSTHGRYVVDLNTLVNDSEIGFNKQSYLGDTAGAEDFIEAFYNEGKSYQRAGLYSLPYMKSSEILLYNKGLFNSIIEDLKLEILEPGETLDDYMKNISWEEFIELCKTIYGRKSEITANTFEYSLAYDSDENFFITKLIQEEIGYSHVGSDEKGIINFDPDVDDNAFKKAKAYVKQYREYYDTGFFNTKGTLGTYASNDFKEQKTLFSVGSSGGAGYNFPAGSAFEVGVCKVPASKNNPQYVNQGLTLTFLKNSKYTDEMNTSKIRLAWQFAKYITNPSNNVELCLDSQGYLPVRKSAIETKEYQKFLLKDNDYARTAKVLINEINGRYFTSAVFKGSAELRAQTGAIFTESLLDKGSDIDAAIDRIFRQHINTAKTKF